MINIKLILSTCCSLLLVGTLSSCSDSYAENSSAEQTAGKNDSKETSIRIEEKDTWYQDGQARLQQQLKHIPNNKPEKKTF